MIIEDFRKASFTAVISDLHLCEEEQINSRFPLWKKYKTRQFFFDQEFCNFLNHIEKKAEGEEVELVLNGDIFDFDSCCSIPKDPLFYVSWFERKTGLHPEEEKSRYKIERILRDHKDWVEGLRNFLMRGHRVIIVIGNHDLELHWPMVKRTLVDSLRLPPDVFTRLRFVEWFYISNGDTLIEHGNQYDPYCMAMDPIHPFIRKADRIEVRVPFGNLATRYMINGMGFFNPHVDTNFIMSAREYIVFFLRYIIWGQPQLMWSWLWRSTATLYRAFSDRVRPSIRSPLDLEERINWIAEKSNTTPRAVRELRELFVPSAASYPLIIARELWLDRAFLVMATFFMIFLLFLIIDQFLSTSIYLFFIPLFMFLPFFIFYSRSVQSEVPKYKEPNERIMLMSSMITKVSRVIYGHTHIVRHEMIGPVEHLNSGTWSPAFKNVECTDAVEQRTFVWIKPSRDQTRESEVLRFTEGSDGIVFSDKSRIRTQTRLGAS